MDTPSRKVIALLIVCTSIVGVVVFINSQQKNAVVTNENIVVSQEFQPILVASDIDEQSSIDSDNDGLKDWEEVIWSSDSHNPDSDEDGTNDGQEVLENRDPIKKGPNDTVSAEARLQIGEKALAGSFSKNSVTDTFSKDFFEGYLVAKQDGTIDLGGQDALIGDLVAKATSELKSIPRYTRSELTTFGNNPVEIEVYGDAFATIQLQKLQDIGTVASQNDLPALALEYKKLAEELYKLDVPEEVADAHLQIINNLNVIHDAYITLSDYEKDPMKSLFAIKEHKRIDEEQVTLYTRIKNYFVKNGIIFDNSEASTFWNKF